MAQIDGAQVKGTWDIAYQQALVVTLENNMRFVANFMYNIMPEDGQTAPPYKQAFSKFERIRDHDFDRFFQHCDRTMVGFVQQAAGKQAMAQHEVLCFYGTFAPGDQAATGQNPLGANQENAQELPSDENVQLGHRQSPRHLSKLQLSSEYPHIPSPAYDIFIQWVNSNSELPWKANSCLMTKSSGDPSCSRESSLVQLAEQTTFGSGPGFDQAL